MAKATAKKTQESLTAKGARWASTWSNAVTVPLILSMEIIPIVDDWDRYKGEVGGITANQWLREVFASGGKGVSYWRRRYNAVQRLGHVSQMTIHHLVAVYVTGGSIPDDKIDAVKWMLVRKCREKKKGVGKDGGKYGVPLDVDQAKREIYKMLGHVAKPKQPYPDCPECEKLKKKIKRLERRIKLLERTLEARRIPVP